MGHNLCANVMKLMEILFWRCIWVWYLLSFSLRGMYKILKPSLEGEPINLFIMTQVHNSLSGFFFSLASFLELRSKNVVPLYLPHPPLPALCPCCCCFALSRSNYKLYRAGASGRAPCFVCNLLCRLKTLKITCSKHHTKLIFWGWFFFNVMPGCFMVSFTIDILYWGITLYSEEEIFKISICDYPWTSPK